MNQPMTIRLSSTGKKALKRMTGTNNRTEKKLEIYDLLSYDLSYESNSLTSRPSHQKSAAFFKGEKHYECFGDCPFRLGSPKKNP